MVFHYLRDGHREEAKDPIPGFPQPLRRLFTRATWSAYTADV
jgi:hypothetical protein